MLTRRMMLLTAAGIGVLPVAIAQGPGGQGGRRGGPGGRGGGMMGGGRMLEMMKERLKLTDEQATKLEAIYKEQSDKMAEMRQNTPEGERPSREALTKLREDTNAKVMEVLTPEQEKEYDKMMEEMRDRMRQGGQRGGGRRPQQQ